ncbi:hypothetical protein R50073_26660 [Maricurvus nonylphenolicus]|uniref:acyltransferase n=1 Tax=Maricurvus nonylphenolicus TaxID=1008307 RepID=UPI0036F20828
MKDSVYYSARKTRKGSYFKSVKLLRNNFLRLLIDYVPLSSGFKVFLYRLMGVNIPDARSVFIGKGVVLDGVFPENITIEPNVMITQGAVILTHFYDPSYEDHAFRVGKITIQKGAFIGAGAYILCDGEIGVGAVVAAASVVTKSVSDFSIVAGMPAKVIGHRGSVSLGDMPELPEVLSNK